MDVWGKTGGREWLQAAREDSSYGDTALETLRRVGFRHIGIYCVKRGCHRREVIEISSLIERVGPATLLVMVARRARCRQCKALGAHVQPEPHDPAMSRW